MKYKSILCMIALAAICFNFSGCFSEDNKTNNNGATFQNNLNEVSDVESTVSTEATTKKKKTYVQNGWFTLDQTQIKEIAHTVEINRKIWKGDLEDNEINFIEFSDLNFDGNLELIVCDNREQNKSDLHSNIYCISNGTMKKIPIEDSVNPIDGFDNYLKTYFDKSNGEYLVFGHNYATIDEYHYNDNIFKLNYDNEKITITYLLRKSTYAPNNTTHESDVNTYFQFNSNDTVEISEKEYNRQLSDIEENGNYVRIMGSAKKDTSIDYESWEDDSSDYQEEQIIDKLVNFKYERYVISDETETEEIKFQ